jgi:hypothetical protein
LTVLNIHAVKLDEAAFSGKREKEVKMKVANRSSVRSLRFNANQTQVTADVSFKGRCPNKARARSNAQGGRRRPRRHRFLFRDSGLRFQSYDVGAVPLGDCLHA